MTSTHEWTDYYFYLMSNELPLNKNSRKPGRSLENCVNVSMTLILGQMLNNEMWFLIHVLLFAQTSSILEWKFVIK